ncbi:Ser/Thr phosphatase family protein, partial [Ostertagia ostertagi]
NAQVKYGTSPSNLPYTATDEGVKKWTSGTSVRYSHKAMMRNLQPLTTYYYQISTRQFSFKTMAENPQSYKACIFGDLGYWHGNSTESLIRNGLAGKFDFIVHLGDIAYDLHTNNGETGDNFMNQLEPLLSKVPYMVIAGNHEDDGKNFTDYQERFWILTDGFKRQHKFVKTQRLFDCNMRHGERPAVAHHLPTIALLLQQLNSLSVNPFDKSAASHEAYSH